MRIAAATEQQWHFAAALLFLFITVFSFRCGTYCYTFAIAAPSAAAPCFSSDFACSMGGIVSTTTAGVVAPAAGRHPCTPAARGPPCSQSAAVALFSFSHCCCCWPSSLLLLLLPVPPNCLQVVSSLAAMLFLNIVLLLLLCCYFCPSIWQCPS